MLDVFVDYFSGKKFGSIEEYNATVLRFTNSVEADLGKIKRWMLTGDKKVLERLGVKIRDDSERKES